MKTTDHAEPALGLSRIIIRFTAVGTPTALRAAASAGGKAMRGLLAALVGIAVLFNASEAIAAQRTNAKQLGGSNALVQTERLEQMVPKPKARSNRTTGTSPTFRAEDIVPDICRGCSS